MSGNWEHFPHGADVGVRGTGDTQAEAFAQAATALTAVVCDPRRVAPREAVPIACREDDPELLLVAWLNELVFEMATRRMLFGKFEVAVGDGALTATAWGEPVDAARHEPAVEVKGATLTELKVARGPDGRWRAQCIVDV